VLIGFMGCGKSFVSKELSKVLQRPLMSTDAWIEAKEGRSIAQIFEESGESHFRNLEREAVKEIAQSEGSIIDGGGGIVLNPQNIMDLKKTGILFYLKASPEFLLKNIEKSKDRPLMKGTDPLAKIKELLQMREPLYNQADYTIDADYKTIDQIAASIVEVISREGI